jgi:hypothetical protein
MPQLQAHGRADAVARLRTDGGGDQAVAFMAGVFNRQAVMPTRGQVARPAQAGQISRVAALDATPSGLSQLQLLQGALRIAASCLPLLRLKRGQGQCSQDGHQGQADQQLAQGPAGLDDRCARHCLAFEVLHATLLAWLVIVST